MADTANILMPMEQEGSKSVVRAWLKQVGDPVKRDEPIVELETDKVAVEVPSPADDHVDCREVACAIYTRNDHTAASDRVQDLYLPIGFAG